MDHDELCNKRVHALACTHGCTVDDVHNALDRHPIELDRDAYLKRTLALELMTLDNLQTAFEDKALRDRDTASGMLLVKVLERRATLLGLNPSPGFAVRVVSHPPVNAPTTHQRLESALDLLITEQRSRANGNGSSQH